MKTTTRVQLAAIAACLSAAVMYAALRVGQKLAHPEPDPALVLYSEHAAYFWRAWIAAYAGGMLGFVTYLVAPKSPRRTANILLGGVTVAAIVITAQGLLVP